MTHLSAAALVAALPGMLVQFVLCLVLLAIGVVGYTLVTPFRERELIREGNAAAATSLSGAVVALAIPLAALLATTSVMLELLAWGVVAILLQLLTVAVATHLMRDMRRMIEAGEVAAALPVVAAQLAIALLNAAAMVPV